MNNKTQPTPEQLAKLENEASKAAIEWWQESNLRINAGRIDAYKAGYLHRCQETEQENEQALKGERKQALEDAATILTMWTNSISRGAAIEELLNDK